MYVGKENEERFPSLLRFSLERLLSSEAKSLFLKPSYWSKREEGKKPFEDGRGWHPLISVPAYDFDEEGSHLSL